MADDAKTLEELLAILLVSDWEKAAVIISGVGAALLLSVLFLQIGSLYLQRKATNSAVRAVDEASAANRRADRESALRLRPLVGVGIVEAQHLEDAGGHITQERVGDTRFVVDLDRVAPTDSVSYSFTITNYGQTPAQQLGVFFGAGMNLEEVADGAFEGAGLRSSVLWPAQSIDVKMLVPILLFERSRMRGEALYFALGTIYADQDDHAWDSRLLLEMRRSTVKVLGMSAAKEFVPTPAEEAGGDAG